MLHNVLQMIALDEESEDEIEDILLLKVKAKIRVRNDISGPALPIPNHSSWAYLRKYGKDQDFINELSIGRGGFELLLSKFILYYNVGYRTARGGRPSRVDEVQALAIVLQFYANPLELKIIAQLHGIPKSTASRTIQKAEDALRKALSKVEEAKVKWPTKDQQRVWGNAVQRLYPAIHGRFGFVDGKNYHVAKPTNIDLQNAMYNGWLHEVFITGVLCFGVDGCIIWGKHNCVGTWNDGDVSVDLQIKLLDPNLVEPDHGLVSDSAFPVGQLLLGKIISPLKDGDLERAHPRTQYALIILDKMITSLRQACEWGVGSVEKPFRQLLLPLPFNPVIREKRLHNIFKLFNLRVRTTGISQVRSTFLGV